MIENRVTWTTNPAAKIFRGRARLPPSLEVGRRIDWGARQEPRPPVGLRALPVSDHQRGLISLRSELRRDFRWIERKRHIFRNRNELCCRRVSLSLSVDRKEEHRSRR